jgi:hypothetical protein
MPHVRPLFDAIAPRGVNNGAGVRLPPRGDWSKPLGRSESFQRAGLLRWGDIDWDRNRFLVHAPKTERHTSWVPIFPELVPLFRERFEEAEPGEGLVQTAQAIELRMGFDSNQDTSSISCAERTVSFP